MVVLVAYRLLPAATVTLCVVEPVARLMVVQVVIWEAEALVVVSRYSRTHVRITWLLQQLY